MPSAPPPSPRTAPAPPVAIVVCALEFERRELARAGLGPGYEIDCCGPGAAAVTRWARDIEPGAVPVVLAGVAGAIRSGPGAPGAGEARIVTAVRREGVADPWRPTLIARRPPPFEIRECTVAPVSAVVTGREQKAVLARATGADLVDLESGAFAEVASELGWTWGVVRGVSDDAATALPEAAGGWVDDRGRPRPSRVVMDLCRRPSLTGPVLRLRRDGAAGLRAAAGLIRTWLDPGG